MANKILIISSAAGRNCLLFQAFKELARQHFSFQLWSSDRELREQFAQSFRPAKKIYLGPDLSGQAGAVLFALIWPLVQFKLIVVLARLKIKRQADAIVCLNLNEKIIATLPARLLKLKIIWLEAPGINRQPVNKFLFLLYRLNSRYAKIAAFNNYSRLRLENLTGANINLIHPGVKPNQYQENIFDQLAAVRQTGFHRKYFTLGSVTALNQRQKIETIFQAVKTCVSVIPNIQLIIIGEGPERKNLLWLAKKMQIENLIWLVGEQGQLKKWLDNLDIYLAAGDTLRLDDYGNILQVMAAGLPVLATRNIGLEDLIMENKTGALIEAGNSEMLARQIIKLHQDKKLRQYLGRNGQERVRQLFTMEKMAENLKELLNN